MDQLSPLLRISVRKLRHLTEMLNEAEFDEQVQIDALAEIEFISDDQKSIQTMRKHYARIERYTTPLFALGWSAIAYLAVATVWDWSIALVFSQVLLGGYVVLIGYHQWIRAECNRNVEDATSKKAAVNAVIQKNISTLFPYVGSAFASRVDYAALPVEHKSQTVIDMYIFAELDNLEFVFQKAKFGLVYPEFAFRAVKIFIARAENERFAQRAMQLVKSGRYNEDFRRVVNELLYLGLFEHEAVLTERRRVTIAASC